MTTQFSNKTSLKAPFQLPEFIRSDSGYQTFVAFIQAYYEWMEQNDIKDSANTEGAIYGTQNLLNYNDVDFVEDGGSFNKFIDYYVNDFLPNFPKEALADKGKLIKVAKQLYSTKGTPASYQFLFRALYNSDAEIFLTRDIIFKASDGKWYVSKSLKLSTNDEQFLSIENLRLFGETSKSIATVERSNLSGDKTEVFISNIERLFQSGEFVRVVDNNNQTLYFKDGKVVPEGTTGSYSLRAKILGTISAVNVDSKKRGQLYKGRSEAYSGDPVVFYGGLNSANGIGAKAFVNETTSGSLRDISLINGSYGYRQDPNTYIQITGGGGKGALANVTSVDPAGQIDVAFIPKDYMTAAIKAKRLDSVFTFFPANTSANLSTSLANAFSFTAFSTYPIASVTLHNGGGGFTTLPSVKATSLYDTTDPQTVDSLKIKGSLASLGILGPIQINTPGTGYANGDIITFTDSAGGVGANANVKVNTTGSIISAQYLYSNTTNGVTRYPKGGLGYSQDHLPTLTVISSGGSNAKLSVNTILGEGATFEPIADERGIGAITSFVIENYGEDYISAPNISLKVRDLVVTNVTQSNIIKTGELVYQGANVNTAVFKAYVDSISLLSANTNYPLNSKYVLRTYNYSSNTKTNLKIQATDRLGANIYMDLDTTYDTVDTETGNYIYKSGIRTYGNGAAQATAKFLNGLIIGQGQYIKDDGFPSSNQILENQDYNNFTYELIVQKSFDAYKDVLFKLVHPSGTKVVPIYALKSHNDVSVHRESSEANSKPLYYYTGTVSSNGVIYYSNSATSNNTIKFYNLSGANLANIITVNSQISLSSATGPNVYSEVISINSSSNTIVIKDNVFTTFANVALGSTTSGNNRINISSVTGQYDIINNGEYSNTDNHIEDMVFQGDVVKIVKSDGSTSHTATVSYISYSNNVIFLNSTPSFSGTNSLVTVYRTIDYTDINIFNNLGTVYYPQLITQSGGSLTTQDGKTLLLG